MNYLLMALCLIITGAFQTSDNIGRAYGEDLLPHCMACLSRPL